VRRNRNSRRRGEKDKDEPKFMEQAGNNRIQMEQKAKIMHKCGAAVQPHYNVGNKE
jgi:hypothetical protein